MNTLSTETIHQYINLKAIEKDALIAVNNLKPLFTAAMDKDFPGGLRSKNATIYKRELSTWQYSKAIQAAETKLKALKKAFEEKNAPVSVSHCWAVKF